MSLSTDIEADVEAVFFSSDDFAVSGVYTPVVGAPVAVSILFNREEEGAPIFQTGAVIGRLQADIPVSQLATAAEGGTLTVGSDSWRVAKAERKDNERLIWSLSLTESP